MEKGERHCIVSFIYLYNGTKSLFYYTMRLLFVCIFCFLVHKADAQKHLIDSLIVELQKPMADSNRAISMMRLAIDYELVDTVKAYKAYNAAIQFALTKNLSFQLGRIYHNKSILLNTAAKFAESRTCLDSAIIFYQKSTHSKAKKFEANAYGDIGTILKTQNDLQQAIQYNLKSVALFEELGLQNELAIRYCNISTLFEDIHEFDKQKEYAYKALASAKACNSTLNKFLAYFILTNYYESQDDIKQSKKYLDSARANFDENANINSVDIIFSFYLISAQVLKKMDQLDSAHYYFQKSLDVSNSYHYSYGKAEAQIQLGIIAGLQKKYNDAEKHLEAGIKEAKAINYFGVLSDGYKELSNIYALTGRYKLAFDFFIKHKELSDSAMNIGSRKNITELEKKYETEKKQNQIDKLEAENKLQLLNIKQKNSLNYSLIAGAFIFLIITILTYRTYKQKQKMQENRIIELETLQQLTATENVLKGEEQERTRLAKDLHDGLGGMLSGIKYSLNTMKGNLIMTPENNQAFERSIDMLDSSIKEMRRVAHNMMPEALVKFGLNTALKDFCNEVNQTGALQVNFQSIGMDNEIIEQTMSITIYRIVQELINNTLKHASAKNAIVQVAKSENSLSVTVEDDGIGFDTSLLNKSKGMGWSNIQNRVDFLKGSLDVRSEKEKGTSVHIELNLV
jgi:two-component system NarL family sensor kinase